MPKAKSTEAKVFERDFYTCRICPTNVFDQIIHAVKIADGSDNCTDNFKTFCQECFFKAIGKKQPRKSKKLENRHRELIAGCVAWQESKELLKTIHSFGVTTTPQIEKRVEGWLQKRTFNQIDDWINRAFDVYLRYDDDNGEPTKDSIKKSLDTVLAVGRHIDQYGDTWDELQELFYVRGILRNHVSCREWKAIELLKEAHSLGADIPYLTEMAKEAKSGQQWEADMGEVINFFRKGGHDAVEATESTPDQQKQEEQEEHQSESFVSLLH